MAAVCPAVVSPGVVVCLVVIGPLVTACGVVSGAVLVAGACGDCAVAAVPPGGAAVAGCDADAADVPAAPVGVGVCVGVCVGVDVDVGVRVAGGAFCWTTSGFTAGCCVGDDVPGRGWLLTAVCGEDVRAGAVLCGADGKALDGFRCGLDASRYLAAACAAC
ncbi:hypothetical protein [Nisaea sp.]|uniref:hypothetical protein n=1 Tax=Nisaea sp. TaxID=2024842 RepID=UPI002B26E197|nr:hypothetical protein [Nisaea sp.]